MHARGRGIALNLFENETPKTHSAGYGGIAEIVSRQRSTECTKIAHHHLLAIFHHRLGYRRDFRKRSHARVNRRENCHSIAMFNSSKQSGALGWLKDRGRRYRQGLKRESAAKKRALPG